MVYKFYPCFPGGLEVKNPSANSEDMGLIPDLGRFPGKENGNPLQFAWRIPCIEEAGRLLSMGHRAGRDSVTEEQQQEQFLY